LDGLRWAFTSFQFGHYQPLTWVSLTVDYELWGLDPFGFHLTNLLLHCATAIALFFVCRAHVESSTARASVLWPCVIATLFYSVHPARVESVAWVTERRDVLCATFLVVSTLCYQHSLKDRRWLLWASFASFVCALLSKASALPMPFVLCLLDISREGRIRWPSKLPFALATLPFLVTAPLAQYTASAAVPWTRLTLGMRLSNAVSGLAYYLLQLVWPHDLAALHELPVGTEVPTTQLRGAASLLVIVALVMLILARRRWPWFRALGLTGLAAFAFLSPVIGLVQSGPQLVAERYLHFAALPVSLLLAAWLSGPLAGPFRKVVVAALVALLAVHSLHAYRYAGTWQSSEALWTQAFAVDPTCATCNEILGGIRLSQGRWAEAEWHFRRALEKKPVTLSSNQAMVEILRRSGRDREELVFLNRLLHLLPEDETLWMETARVLWVSRRQEDLSRLLDRLPAPLTTAAWVRDYRWALAAVGRADAAPSPPTAGDLDRVVALLKAAGCPVADLESSAIPQGWVADVVARCRG